MTFLNTENLKLSPLDINKSQTQKRAILKSLDNIGKKLEGFEMHNSLNELFQTIKTDLQNKESDDSKLKQIS